MMTSTQFWARILYGTREDDEALRDDGAARYDSPVFGELSRSVSS